MKISLTPNFDMSRFTIENLILKLPQQLSIIDYDFSTTLGNIEIETGQWKIGNFSYQHANANCQLKCILSMNDVQQPFVHVQFNNQIAPLVISGCDIVDKRIVWEKPQRSHSC